MAPPTRPRWWGVTGAGRGVAVAEGWPTIDSMARRLRLDVRPRGRIGRWRGLLRFSASAGSLLVAERRFACSLCVNVPDWCVCVLYFVQRLFLVGCTFLQSE